MAPLSALDELALLLRPAGGGVYLVSTGRAAQETLQRRLYGAADMHEVQERFHHALARIAKARMVILGIPSDVGAGYQRGANLGPQALRTGLLDADPDWARHMDARGIVDLGDVFVVPQLLHDDMLSDAQKQACQRALYPSVPGEIAAELPVSPLSIAERALDLVFAQNPHIAPVVLGGDHSTAWPVVSALSRVRRDPWAIVQPDAHTDLLPERLGIKYCFATWSYHANQLLGGPGRLVQVGTRASRHDRAHWEETLQVRQFWAAECRRDPARALDDLVLHLRSVGAKSVYFSNDIDGTDEAYADATGTPEPEGLEPDFVVELIRRVGRDVGLLGGDLMELAPPLQPRPDSTARTVRLAVRYLTETMTAILAGPAPVSV
jgi:agmatinase